MMSADGPDQPLDQQDPETGRPGICAGATDAFEGRLHGLQAAIFDLDGVVTRTARLHAAAWKHLFDAYLRSRAERSGLPFEPFDAVADYRLHVDGKPRYQGVRDLLSARGITLPEGTSRDPPEAETICGLGNRKDALFKARLAQGGVEVFEGSVAFIRALRRRGWRIALASSSRNATAVARAAGLADLFDAQVDGVASARLGLKGKPDPDIFERAAELLGMPSARCLVVEDALAGVEAGKAGGFGLVIGVDRQGGMAQEMRAHGADIVVEDLVDIVPAAPPLPNALTCFSEIVARIGKGRRPAVFLDYDGTLTPIVARPELAVLSEEMRAAVRNLAALCPVAVISGRDRADVARIVGLEGLVYAGSHGFDIAGPGLRASYTAAEEYLSALDAAEASLRKALADVAGALVERKRFAIAVHYRLVADADTGVVDAAVEDALAVAPGLRRTGGKKIFELRPHIAWDKGRAVLWLLEALGLNGPDAVPLYLGDDETDEDAFTALGGRGIGILVAAEQQRSAAGFTLRSPDEVRRFLLALAAMLEEGRGT